MHVCLFKEPNKKIYIIDDHEIFLRGLKFSIKEYFQNTKAFIFVQPEELYQFSLENKPDLIIADFKLSNGKIGLDVILRIRTLHKDLKTILISSAKEDRIKELCQQNHIQGYIYKSEPEKIIHLAIQSILEGSTYYTKEILNNGDVEVVKNYDKKNNNLYSNLENKSKKVF